MFYTGLGFEGHLDPDEDTEFIVIIVILITETCITALIMIILLFITRVRQHKLG